MGNAAAAPSPAQAGEGWGGGNDASLLWKLSVPPSDGARIAAAICDRLDAELFFDWAGGLLWVATPSADSAPAIRGLLNGSGHATLLRAPDDLRASVEVFQPLPEPLMALTRRVKDGFDPRGILSPGRMYAGV